MLIIEFTALSRKELLLFMFELAYQGDFIFEQTLTENKMLWEELIINSRVHRVFMCEWQNLSG